MPHLGIKPASVLCLAFQSSILWTELSCPTSFFWLGGGGGGPFGQKRRGGGGGGGQEPFDQKLGWILYWHGLIHNEVSRKIRSKVHLLVFFANNKTTKQLQVPVKGHKPYAYQYCCVQLCFSTSKYYNKVPSHIFCFVGKSEKERWFKIR